MHRLFFKIFLWFWLAIVAVSGTLVLLTQMTHSRAEDDRRWHQKYGPRMDLWSRQEAHILRVEGTASLEKYVKSFQTDPGMRNYIFDATGHEVLGRQATKPVMQALATLNQSSQPRQLFDDADRIIAQKIYTTTNVPYVVVLDFPEPTLLSRSLFELLFADLDRKAIGRLIAVLSVAGIVCFWLTRQIVGPIDQLRVATRRIADEHLETRVDSQVLTRRDELADLGRDFDRMAERIEALVAAHRHFLADASHALRSPLARLNVALALVRRRPESQATAEHLDRIERETERLNVLIGQLLVMARLDSGVDLERKASFDLGLLVDEVAADADYEARGRQCTVEFTQPFPCPVEGAREMLRGAVENVVRNGVRHTAAGTSVDITVSCPHTESDPRVVVTVRDHGPGVPEGSLVELFTPFHHIESGWQGGDRTGLGLAITKRTLDIHGGAVRAANAPGGGLIVTLELPLVGAVNVTSIETEGDLGGQRDSHRVAVERRNALRAV